MLLDRVFCVLAPDSLGTNIYSNGVLRNTEFLCFASIISQQFCVVKFLHRISV